LAVWFTTEDEVRADEMGYEGIHLQLKSYIPRAVYAFHPASGTMQENPVPEADQYITVRHEYEAVFTLRLPMAWQGRYATAFEWLEDSEWEKEAWRFLTADGTEEIFTLLVLPQDAAAPQDAVLLGDAWGGLDHPDSGPPSWAAYILIPEGGAGEAEALRGDIPAIVQTYESILPVYLME